jgi:tRNA G18 (ribose-2'-O)-methylase SpoU
MENIYVALENLRSLYNIGAIFRTCSFFGVKKVLLAGYSGRNFDTKGRVVLHEEIKKSSLSSEKDLEIIFTDDLVKYAADNKLKIISIEQHPDSIALQDWKPESDTILVFGNEVDGVSTQVLEASEEIVEIEKSGTHNSLNVTTSCGIVLFHLQSSGALVNK